MRITLKLAQEVAVLMGQYQMPMPHLITEGQITKGNQKIPMYVAQLITHGNGIALASGTEKGWS